MLELKVKYLGKKGIITELNSKIKDIPNEEKKEFGMKVNEVKNIFNMFLGDIKEAEKENIKRENIYLIYRVL